MAEQVPFDLTLFEEIPIEEALDYIEGKYSKELAEEIANHVEFVYRRKVNRKNIISL